MYRTGNFYQTVKYFVLLSVLSYTGDYDIDISAIYTLYQTLTECYFVIMVKCFP